MKRLIDEELQKVCGWKDIQGVDGYERDIAQAQLESCEREAETQLTAELKKVKKEIEKFSWYRNEVGRDIVISESNWDEFWKEKGIE